jgi:cobalt-zinc-cadmium efflux system outer membrane protein
VTPHVIALLLAASPAAAAPTSAEPSPAAPVWTEADALAALGRGSPALADARAAEAAARGELTQAGLVPNPTLSLGAANLPVHANTTPSGDGNGVANNLVTSVGIDQPIELGGKRGRRVAQARSALAAATASRADALRTATFELRRAFWDAVRARERRALAEQVLSRYAETTRITRARFESQDISAIDLEKVELEGAKHENDLADAVAAQRSSVAQLLALVGPAAPPTVQVQGDLAVKAPALDPERLTARARDARPDLAAARHATEAARAAVRVAEAQAVPDLTVGASYTRSRAIAAGDNPDALAFTLALPLPLFHRNQGDIARARAEAERTQHAAAALEAQVRQEVLAAHARYAAAGEKVTRYEGGTLQRAERALSIAEKTWRAGDRSLLELLEAERTYIELRADYLDTLFELREARLQLERAVAAPLGEGER